ncbi:MAG: universal stress protein [Flavobacteriales bacterium]
MDKKIFKVLVPHDFSTVADCAVNHASKIANSFNGEVHLLHVVSKQKEVDAVKEKLTKIAEKAEKNTAASFHVIVRIGNIFEDIGDVASEIGAGFIVMGTHGAKGMQKIMGSYALRVISHSKVPFVVVQNKDPKATDTYDDIVVPVDHSDVTKQKLAVATNIAAHFGSKIHLFYENVKDEFLKKKLDRELSFAKNYFLERKIAYTMNQAEEDGSLKKQLIKFAARIDADLIAVVNTQEGALLPDFFGSDEQEVIANDAEIPVIITNPTQQVVAGGVLGT